MFKKKMNGKGRYKNERKKDLISIFTKNINQ